MTKRIAIILPFLWVGFLYFLSTKTPEQLSSIPIPQSSSAHIPAYFVFGFFTILALELNTKSSFLKNAAIVLFVGLLAGSLDETIQFFTPGRTPTIYDVIRDVLGVFLSLVFYYYLNKFLKIKKFILSLKKPH